MHDIRKNMVSILVFLEVPLQQSGISKRLTHGRSFNPCFSGSSTATKKVEIYKKFYNGFQSLFFWKFHCNTDEEYKILKFFMFQSLFFWKFHCNYYDTIYSDSKYNMFQSLFFWKFHCNLQKWDIMQ